MKTFNKPQPLEKNLLKKKTHLKLKVLVGIFIISLFICAGYGVKSFFEKYYFTFPIRSF